MQGFGDVLKDVCMDTDGDLVMAEMERKLRRREPADYISSNSEGTLGFQTYSMKSGII